MERPKVLRSQNAKAMEDAQIMQLDTEAQLRVVVTDLLARKGIHRDLTDNDEWEHILQFLRGFQSAGGSVLAAAEGEAAVREGEVGIVGVVGAVREQQRSQQQPLLGHNDERDEADGAPSEERLAAETDQASQRAEAEEAASSGAASPHEDDVCARSLAGPQSSVVSETSSSDCVLLRLYIDHSTIFRFHESLASGHGHGSRHFRTRPAPNPTPKSQRHHSQ